MNKKRFPLHKSTTCPECAPIRHVRYLLNHVTLLGLMPTQQESEGHGEKHGLGVICVPLCKEPRTKSGCSEIQH